jgi:hypothetical protein
MASSFINYKNNGFWASDTIAEAFDLLIFQEITNKFGNAIDWLNEYKANLALQSLPIICGGMSMELDEYLIDNSRVEIILSIITDIKEKINNKKDYLTSEHLNSLKKNIREYLVEVEEVNWSSEELEKNLFESGFYVNPLPVQKYSRAFDLLEKLISGQINYNASTPITYWE